MSILTTTRKVESNLLARVSVLENLSRHYKAFIRNSISIFMWNNPVSIGNFVYVTNAEETTVTFRGYKLYASPNYKSFFTSNNSNNSNNSNSSGDKEAKEPMWIRPGSTAIALPANQMFGSSMFDILYKTIERTEYSWAGFINTIPEENKKVCYNAYYSNMTVANIHNLYFPDWINNVANTKVGLVLAINN